MFFCLFLKNFKEGELKKFRVIQTSANQMQEQYEKLVSEHDNCRVLKVKIQEYEFMIEKLEGDIKQRTEEFTVLMAEKNKMKTSYAEVSSLIFSLIFLNWTFLKLFFPFSLLSHLF